MASLLVTAGYVAYLALPRDVSPPPEINLFLFPILLFLTVFIIAPVRTEQESLWARVFALLFLAIPGSLAIYFYFPQTLTAWLLVALILTGGALLESRWRKFFRSEEFSAVIMVLLTASLLLHELALQLTVPILAALSAALLFLQKRYPSSRLNDSAYLAWLIGIGVFVLYVFTHFEGDREIFYLTLLPSLLLLTGQLAWFPDRPAFRFAAAGFLAAGASLLLLRETFPTEHLLTVATLLGAGVLALNFHRPAHCWVYLFLLLGGGFLIVLFRGITGIDLPAESWFYFPAVYALWGLSMGTGSRRMIIHLPWILAMFLSSYWSGDFGPALLLLAFIAIARVRETPVKRQLERIPAGWVLVGLSIHPIFFTLSMEDPARGYLYLPLLIGAWLLSGVKGGPGKFPLGESGTLAIGAQILILSWIYLIFPSPSWFGFPTASVLPLLILWLVASAGLNRIITIPGIRAGQWVILVSLLLETAQLGGAIPLLTLSLLFLSPLLAAWLMEVENWTPTPEEKQTRDWRKFSLFGTVLLLLGVSLQSDPTWSTVQIVAGASVLLMVGLWKQQQTIRVVGLILFGIALARLFLFDLQDNLHRIFAFAVVGGVCLLVGYLYQRAAGQKDPENER